MAQTRYNEPKPTATPHQQQQHSSVTNLLSSYEATCNKGRNQQDHLSCGGGAISADGGSPMAGGFKLHQQRHP